MNIDDLVEEVKGWAIIIPTALIFYLDGIYYGVKDWYYHKKDIDHEHAEGIVYRTNIKVQTSKTT